jgi:hypothetical protein
MKKHLGWVLAIGLGLGTQAWADDTADKPADDWKKQVDLSLNLNQGAFNNWAQGGSNFVSWQAGINARFEQDNAGVNWLNTLKLQYGLTYVDLQGTRITSDTIDLESVYSWKLWEKVSPYISFSALDQFGPGYNYTVTPALQISGFMDPGYFTESAGLKYTPDPVFNTRIGLGVKETFADQFRAVYSQGQAVLTQVGLSWVSELHLKLSETSTFNSKLDAFWPGGALDRTVVQWDNLLAVGITKVLNITIENDYRYDPAVYNGVQIRELAGLGIGFSLL